MKRLASCKTYGNAFIFAYAYPGAIAQLVELRQIRKKKSKDFAHETTAMQALLALVFGYPYPLAVFFCFWLVHPRAFIASGTVVQFLRQSLNV